VYRSLDAFLCLFGLVQFTPRRAIRCDLALWRALEGSAEQRILRRAATRRSAHTLSYPYPPPAAAPSCTYTRQEEPTWPWAPEASRPTVRWGAWSCVGRPGAAATHAMPMRHVSSRQHDKEIPRSVHASYLRVALAPRQFCTPARIVHSKKKKKHNYKEWTILGTGDLPFLSGDLAH